MTVGFLGAGNMGGALLRGLKGKETLSFYDTDRKKAEALAHETGAACLENPQDLALADAVVLAVKPQVLQQALLPLREPLQKRRPTVISIAAGTPVSLVARYAGDETLPIVRAMPNVAAKVGQAITALCAGENASDEQLQTARRIFESVGETVVLPENLFGIFSVLAGCSPAFTLMYIDALATAGVRGGLPKSVALKCVTQAVSGVAALLAQTGEHPRALMDSVCSPAGTTVEGVAALQREGFEHAVLAAAEASLKRDIQLSGQ